MKIQYKNYLLSPTDNGRWDFLKAETRQKIGTGTKNAPNGEFYPAEIIIGYDMRMESIVQEIVEREAVKSLGDLIVGFNEYFEQYVKCKNELIKVFNEKIKN